MTLVILTAQHDDLRVIARLDLRPIRQCPKPPVRVVASRYSMKWERNGIADIVHARFKEPEQLGISHCSC